MKSGICDRATVMPHLSSGAARIPLPVVPKARFQRDGRRCPSSRRLAFGETGG